MRPRYLAHNYVDVTVMSSGVRRCDNHVVERGPRADRPGPSRPARLTAPSGRPNRGSLPPHSASPAHHPHLRLPGPGQRGEAGMQRHYLTLRGCRGERKPVAVLAEPVLQLSGIHASPLPRSGRSPETHLHGSSWTGFARSGHDRHQLLTRRFCNERDSTWRPAGGRTGRGGRIRHTHSFSGRCRLPAADGYRSAASDPGRIPASGAPG